MPLSQLFFWAVPIIALASYCILMLFFSISKKDKFIRMFMLILASSIFWTASSLFMKMQLYPGPLFWNRMMVAGMVIYPFLLYCFVSVFTNSSNIFRAAFWGIATIIALIVNFLGLIVTDAYVITNTVVQNGRQLYLVEFSYALGKMAIPLYIFMFVIIMAILFKAKVSTQSGNAAYGRVRLVTVGILVMFIGQLFNIVPTIGKYPVDILACFINAILIMIAIYKYRLLELRFMVTRGIVFSLFSILLTGSYVYFVFFMERRITNSYREIFPYFTTLSALLVAVIFQPLYGFTRRLVDKMFYKAEYSQRQALRNFSVGISNNLDLDNIAGELIEAVQLAIHAGQVYVLLKHEQQHYSVFRSSSLLYQPNFEIPLDNPLIKWLTNNNAALSREQIYSIPFFKSMWEKEKKFIYDFNIEVIIPIKSRDDLIGMLMLTKKDNNTAYTLDDLDLLTYLGASTAVAIDNARLYTQAQSEALTDSLTKLYNHRYFCKALPEQVELIGSAELSLLMVDLDFFKLFNDLYGHFEGDKALEMVATIMKRIVGDKGIISRYGGEEFAILLPYHDAKKAFDLAEKIRLEIQRTFFNLNDTTQRFLTASIGICTYPHAAPNAVELLKRADFAMYNAKNRGKNQTVIYTPNFVSSGKSYGNIEGEKSAEPSYAATIYALTAAIDAKDHYTFGHSQRVAKYAVLLASSLGLDKSHLEIIREAALLHDIGKIGIPENILTKTGSLTDGEYEIVKRHVEMSITMIKHLPSLNHVIPAVVGHHERWDGRGYPRGLKGEEIPLSARCLAITDSFDAMTSNRPYREGLSVDSALGEIEKNLGIQFDPQIARLFIKLVQDEVIEVEQTVKTREAF
jgi:diguanylate cyclase (GGDEF)-like protein/putative nucleotidyltransferase with HDIG domain